MSTTDATANQVVAPPLPDWATAFGQDQYGYFADFTIRTGDKYHEFVSQRMRWIPPGTFLMGSPENEPGRFENERQHEVEITTGYWLANTACSQKMWKAVMGNDPSHFPGEKLPVEQVSFNDVLEFLAAVNRLLPSLQLALPTEAQWEHACRCGRDAEPFSFGRHLTTDQANYNGNYPLEGSEKGVYRKRTVNVDQFIPNNWGLFQMHGNVWEWCQDWYAEYNESNSPQHDPQGPSSGSERVLRGGSWVSDARSARSAARSRVVPDVRINFFGFRCLSSASQVSERASASEE